MDAPTVEVLGIRVTLRKPSPLSAVAVARTADQLAGMEVAEYYALAACALAECWPTDVKWPTPVRPRGWRPGVKAADYGRDVFDALAEAGAEMGGLCGALIEAHRWAVLGGLTRQEVDAARDFSGAPEGG